MPTCIARIRDCAALPLPLSNLAQQCQPADLNATARRPACGLQAANSPPPGPRKMVCSAAKRDILRNCKQLRKTSILRHFSLRLPSPAPAQPRSLPPRSSPRCRLRRPAALSPSARGHSVGRGWAAPRAPPPARPQSCRRRAQPCPSRPLLSRSPPATLVPRPGLFPSR